MNKQKFQEKVQELYAHEDETYVKVLEHIKPFKEELATCGCEMDCEIFWSYRDKQGDLCKSRERIAIKKYHVYACNVRLLIHEASDSWEDDDSECIQIIDDVSGYYAKWFGWVFRKSNCDYIFGNLSELVSSIKEKGLDGDF